MSHNSVIAAVLRARTAQPAWGATPPVERAAIIDRFRRTLFRRRAEVAELITRENGKPRADAMVDVTVTLEAAAWVSRHAPRLFRSRWRAVAGILFWRKRARVERTPFGVVGIISPWNYPLYMPAGGALPALACGNAVVLKPSEFTHESGAVIQSLLREAGLPEGVFEVVAGDGEVGAALVRAGVDKVVFTGSEATGRKVAAACADQLIPCALELGGSDAALVLADADVRHAADGIAWSRFANAGQTCVSPKRVFVDARVHDAFVAGMSRAVAALRIGEGGDAESDVGPMIHAPAVALIRAQRDEAVAKGARVVAEGAPALGGARFFPPTVITQVDPSSRALTEETFGPLLPIIPVRDEEEGIRRANATTFGLSASVWTTDRARGLAVARRLQAGTVMLNDATSVVGMPSVPYGGVKRSGIGRQHGEAGLEEFVQLTSIVDDRFAAWRQPWWFRYGPRHLEHLDAYQRLAHAPSWVDRVRALPGVLRLILARKGSA